ncbi:cobalamin biosynthesis protein CobD/CbiB [Bacilliculturomica massiliensis]|uniref:cobalamin biosynthesis protein CobD/CbiB n=1 Tax=Bacilliculturomica massiliensis TaxID=1917867 RepID=UPI0010304624|nr:CobD/CbiB family cobalamin biosynthesis protein [Bacilliculturomica massiliensis]
MISVTLGFLADLIFGDPDFLPHPIRLIGTLIEKGEALIRPLFPAAQRGERAAGTVLAIIVMSLSFLVPALLLWGASLIHPLLALGLEAVMCYQILAVKGLKTESMKVYHALAPSDIDGRCDLEKARFQVSMIVGRDTKELTEEQVAKAAVETVAENTSDGTVAPMLSMALGAALSLWLTLSQGSMPGLIVYGSVPPLTVFLAAGTGAFGAVNPVFLSAPFGFLYKSVNTMDSMIGYKNDRYLYFGRTAARLDDLLNFIPARVSAFLMIAGSFLLRLDWKNAFRVFRRDRFNHASPNSAQTEAVCAGALDIQLAGDAYYFGKLCPKQTIGDPLRPVEREDIVRAGRLLYVTAWLCLILCLTGIGAAILWFS